MEETGIKTRVSQVQGCEQAVEVEIPWKILEPEFEQAYKNYRRKVRLEGFRKGKVPMRIVKQLFGEQIEAEAKNSIIQKYFRQVVEKEDLHPLSEGVIDDVQYQRGEKLAFRVRLEVEPRFELQDLKGISLKKEIRRVKDEDVNQELERLRFRYGTSEAVESGAEKGNFILTDIQKVDTSTKIPIIGSKWEDRYFQLGSDDEDNDEELVEQLTGVKAGDSREVVMRTQTGIVESSPGSNTENYIFKIKRVENVKLPELDDEFAKDISSTYKTLDDLKKSVRSSLEAMNAENSKRKFNEDLRNAIIQRHDIPVPQRMVESYIGQLVESHKKQTQEAIDEGMLQNEFRPIAIKEVKWYLIKKKVIEKYHLEVTQAEVDRQVETLTKVQNLDSEKARLMYGSKKARGEIEGSLLDAKLFNQLESMIAIDEVEV